MGYLIVTDQEIITKDAYNAIAAAALIAKKRARELDKMLDSIILRCEKEKAEIGQVFHDSHK